jgi:uncharacterized protein (DUF488 family)
VKLWTFGYSGKRVEDLAARLEAMPDAMLIDVRLMPRSRAVEWSGTALHQRFGTRYLHLRQFGNVNYKTNGPILLADAEGGISALANAVCTRPHPEKRAMVVLLCACLVRAHCHREAVAAILVKQYAAEDAGELYPLADTTLQGNLWGALL